MLVNNATSAPVTFTVGTVAGAGVGSLSTPRNITITSGGASNIQPFPNFYQDAARDRFGTAFITLYREAREIAIADLASRLQTR